MPPKDRKPRPAPPGLDRLRRSATASAASADLAPGRLAAVPASADQEDPVDQASVPAQATRDDDERPVTRIAAAVPSPSPEPPGSDTAAEQSVEPSPEEPTTVRGELGSRQPTASITTRLAAVRNDEHEPVAQHTRETETLEARSVVGGLTAEDARQAVVDSYLSARHHPAEWVPAGIRLPVSLRDRLEERLVHDQDVTGNYKLALAHYVNAALALIPDKDLAIAAEWALAYLRSLGMESPRTIGTGTRLHGDVAKRMQRLPARLRRQSRYGLAGHLHAAAVAKLLDALDASEHMEESSSP